VSAVAPASRRRARRAPRPTRPDMEPRRAEGAPRAPRAGRTHVSPVTALLMALCAALLAGIVFVQVAVLQQNMDRGKLSDQRAELQARNQDLQAQVDEQTSEQAIVAAAVRLGMYRPQVSSVEQLTGG
jgi:cell division protein FtsL